MKQTGQLKIIKNGASVNFANKVTFIFTKKDGSKITRDTAATGSWDFDVPNGDYFISAFVTDSTEKKTEQFRGGLLFVVNAQTKVTALDEWIGTGSVDAKDPNKDWWENLLKETQKASTEAKEARDEIKNNSIGDANGKWLKEGASKSDFLNTFGNYYSQDIMPYLKAGDTGLSYAKHFETKNTGLDFANTGINENEFLYYEVQKNYSVNNTGIIEFKGYRGRPIYAQAYKRVDGTWTKPVVFYNQENTTVDSNGNIKKASPIIKLFDDHVEWNQDFKEDPIFEKLGIGVYKISNTNGLARGITHGDWYIETPKNRNGLPYFMVEWEQDDITDDVIIKVFDRKFDINIGDFVNGEPHDIGKDERWIDLRFHEQIYSLTNELPDINVPYHELWGIEPYIPPIVEPIEEDIALEDQRAF